MTAETSGVISTPPSETPDEAIATSDPHPADGATPCERGDYALANGKLQTQNGR